MNKSLKSQIYKYLVSIIGFAALLNIEFCQISYKSDRESVEATSIEIVRRFSQALNDLYYNVLKESLSEGAVWHFGGRTIQWTPESEMRIQSTWKKAFPDSQYRIELIFANWDTVTVLYTYTGIHIDTILDIPTTGKSVAVPEMIINRIEDG